MLVYGYLRASTDEQDAERAREELEAFAAKHGHRVAHFYIENASGASLNRPQLKALIENAKKGDVLLVESIDRLSRLNMSDWEVLEAQMDAKGIQIVSEAMPGSEMALKESDGDEDEDYLRRQILKVVNKLLLGILANSARDDYELRRKRQAQGIDSARAKGKYKGAKRNDVKREGIAHMLRGGATYSEVREQLNCSYRMIAEVSKDLSGV